MGNYTLEIYKAKFYLSLYLLLDQHDKCWVISKHNCDWVLVCCVYGVTPHDDVTKWKHFPCYWPFVRGIHQSPVNSTRKGQWRGALMLSLIYTWINASEKWSWGWWFETPSRSLWRHCNVNCWHFLTWIRFLPWSEQGQLGNALLISYLPSLADTWLSRIYVCIYIYIVINTYLFPFRPGDTHICVINLDHRWFIQ